MPGSPTGETDRHRAAEPTGWTLGTAALASIGVLWALLCLNRIVWLIRPDGSGHSLADSVSDSIIRAAALEWVYGLPLAIPAIIAALGRRGGVSSRRLVRAIRVWLVATGAFVLVVSIVDMEVVRFIGGHLTITMVRSYVNGPVARLATSVLRSDPGGPFVGVALLVGSVLLFVLWHAVAWGRLIRGHSARRFSAALAIALAGLCLAYTIAFVIGSPPRRTRWRVAPVVVIAATDLRSRDVPVTPTRLEQITSMYRQEWFDGASPTERTEWVFPVAGYPMFRMTAHGACARGLGAANAIDCSADDDHDGFSLMNDCNDHDPSVHPGAIDQPGDGVDQDCDGVDRDPWNIVVFILESHRGAGVGYLTPWGAEEASATPVLDRLARDGTAFTRVWANGLPSIVSFMTIHTGVEPHPTRYVATDFTTVQLQGFPALLGAHGYVSRFFSVAPPSLDNESVWVNQWYSGLEYAGDALDDHAAFARMAHWLKTERPRDRPFLVTCWTGTNHVPFEGNRRSGIVPAGLDLAHRLPHSMRWVDKGIGEFLDEIGQEPWFDHTVVILTGDHGFPVGEHGSFRILDGLFGESTWVPLVMAGRHPKLTARRGFDHRVASHVDVAPTILDLAGIEAPVSFTGHSLLRPAGPRPTAVSLMAPEVAYASGDVRFYMEQPGQSRQRGDEAFRTSEDRLDRIAATLSDEERQQLRAAALARYELSAWAYGADAVVPRPSPPARR